MVDGRKVTADEGGGGEGEGGGGEGGATSTYSMLPLTKVNAASYSVLALSTLAAMQVLCTSRSSISTPCSTRCALTTAAAGPRCRANAPAHDASPAGKKTTKLSGPTSVPFTAMSVGMPT